MKQFHNSKDWYEALKAIAKKHDNETGVRDQAGWSYNWFNESPEEAYYSEFPRHKSDAVQGGSV